MVEMNLMIEVRSDEFFAQFMRLAAEEGTCNPASVATRNCIVRLGSTFVWA